MQVNYIKAENESHFQCATKLLYEYAGSLVSLLDSNDFYNELQYLRMDFQSIDVSYAPPQNSIFLAFVNETVAGCIGLRRFTENIAEIKRLYVRPQHRGMGIGKGLCTSLIAQAEKIGYSELRLDTCATMTEAIALYKNMGFRVIDAPCSKYVIKDTVSMQLTLKNPTEKIEIREALPVEVPVITEILHKSFLEIRPFYTPEAYEATVLSADKILLRMKEGPVWVAVYNNEIVGTISAVEKGKGTLYIRSMSVLPHARDKKIGYLLLMHVKHYAIKNGYNRLMLKTSKYLLRAITLYERFGFKRTSEQYNFYGIPLFVMAKSLQAENK